MIYRYFVGVDIIVKLGNLYTILQKPTITLIGVNDLINIPNCNKVFNIKCTVKSIIRFKKYVRTSWLIYCSFFEIIMLPAHYFVIVFVKKIIHVDILNLNYIEWNFIDIGKIWDI